MERPKDRPRRAAPVIRMNEKSPALIICAILLTFLFDTMPHSSRDLSAELTAHRTPTLLQQLASFTALREVAEEQDLDWGAPSVFGGEKTFGLRLRPSDESSTSPDPSSLSLSSNAPSSGHSAVSSRRRPHRRQRVGAKYSTESEGAKYSTESEGAKYSTESEGAKYSTESEGAKYSTESEGAKYSIESEGAKYSTESEGAKYSIESEGAKYSIESEGAKYSTESEGAKYSTESEGAKYSTESEGAKYSIESEGAKYSTESEGAKYSIESEGAKYSIESEGAKYSIESEGAKYSAESERATADSGAGGGPATSPRSPWAQLHVMDIAHRTGDRPLVERTDQLLRRERMYPIVYRCELRSVAAAREEELIHSPTTGLDTSRFWSCRTCGKAHDAVRESCLRCRRPGPYAKLFVGQALKETDCARSVLRLLRATHPDIAVHRIEPHKQKDGERGRGCASLYVYPDAAQELKTKLHGNVFFDVDDDGQGGVDEKDAVHVYYVYPTQRRWLDALVAFRTGRGRSHSAKKRSTLPWGTLVVQDAANTHKIRQS